MSEDPSITGVRVDGPKGNHIECKIKVWVGKTCLQAYYMNDVINSATYARMDVIIYQVDNWGHDSQSKVYDREKYSLYIDLNDNRLWKSEGGQLVTPAELVDMWLQKLSARIEKK